jgi:hypothetical protein
MNNQKSLNIVNIDNNFIRNNSFDYFLTILISLQIFGGLGGSLQPIRVFILICTPFLINHFLKNKSEIRHYQYELFLFLVWFLYAIISLLWVVNLTNGIKGVIYLIINFLGVLTIFYFAKKAKNPILSIIKGWALFIVISLPIAFYEIFYDVHFPMSAQDSGTMIGGLGIIRKFASVTFGNYNEYNVQLVYGLPFILSGLFINYKNRILLILNYIVLLAIFFVLVTNGSRGALLSFLIFLLVFVKYVKVKKALKIVIISFIGLVIIVLVSYFKDVFFFLLYRLSNQGFGDSTRLDIAVKSLKLLGEYYLLGVGSGNFQTTMAANYNIGISAAHNFFLEVLVTFGIFIFLLFMGLFWRIIRYIHKNNALLSRYIVIATLIAYPIISIINSSYLLGIYAWIHIASLYIIADRRYLNVNSNSNFL